MSIINGLVILHVVVEVIMDKDDIVRGNGFVNTVSYHLK